MDFDRLKLLEQQLSVMQKEVNEVLGEVQIAMQGMSKANKMAFEVLLSRIQELEQRVGTVAEKDSRDGEGKEL